jgi:hypothetical protein
MSERWIGKYHYRSGHKFATKKEAESYVKGLRNPKDTKITKQSGSGGYYQTWHRI